MFETDTSLHDLQDQLREEMKRERRRMFVFNMMAIVVGIAVVLLYWYLF
jgi:predicted nucleic acid-binding Zn ribbon protein